MSRLWLLAAAVLLAACSAADEAPPETAPLAPADAPGVIEAPLCEATDRAFAARAISELWGRIPFSSHELDVLAALVEQSSRAEVVRAMTRSPEYVDRWSRVLGDLLSSNVVGVRTNEACWAPSLAEAPPELAAFVRDSGPFSTSWDLSWTASDLIRSALRLDDLSPVYRAWLFVQVGSRLVDVDDPQTELSYRALYGNLFQQDYLGRRMGCLRCHNSEFSVTGPFSFPVRGLVERAVFGDSAGRADADLAAFFRVDGVLSMVFLPDSPDVIKWGYGEGTNPWGMSGSCGEFIEPGDVAPDPYGQTPWLVREFTDTASIWDLEGLLREGFEAIRGTGPAIDPDSGELGGEEALAWMISVRLADRVWHRLTGHRLTAPHFLPRNPFQRDVLEFLASTFVESGFSLRELLVAALTHPYAVLGPAEECAVGEHPFTLSPIFDPWTVHDELVERRNNDPGDAILRKDARVLTRSLIAALEWRDPRVETLVRAGEPLEDALDSDEYEAFVQLETDLGAYMSDTDRGFRGSSFAETLAWDSAVAGCRPPWDPTAPDDFVTRLLASAGAEHTLEDAVVALKDRLITQPELSDPQERDLLEILLDAPLSARLAEVEAPEPRLRRVCGVLLTSPDFLLGGAPAPALPDGAAPRLRPADLAPVAVCEGLVGLLYDQGEVSCGGDGLPVR